MTGTNLFDPKEVSPGPKREYLTKWYLACRWYVVVDLCNFLKPFCQRERLEEMHFVTLLALMLHCCYYCFDPWNAYERTFSSLSESMRRRSEKYPSIMTRRVFQTVQRFSRGCGFRAYNVVSNLIGSQSRAIQ